MISDAFVHRVNYDAFGVVRRAYCISIRSVANIASKAKVVVLTAHAIETPRLLLMSANNAYPDGSQLQRPGGQELHEPSNVAGLWHFR